MIINHNLQALYSYRHQKNISLDVDKDIKKLTTGVKINTASDDAANLAVSDKMRNQIRGSYQAEKNAENGISFVQTTEGYLNEAIEIVQRLRELAIKSANEIYSSEDRSYIQVEVNQLVDELDRISSHAQFNGLNMLTGRFATFMDSKNNPTSSMWFHIGANTDQREQIFIATVTSKALNLREIATDKTISLSTSTDANIALGNIDFAIKKLNSQRADIGAYQNRLEHAVKKIMNEAQNLQDSESTIRDTDMADQTVSYFKNKVLLDKSNAFIAQANIKSQSVFNFLP